jgi:hypothetical protein
VSTLLEVHDDVDRVGDLHGPLPVVIGEFDGPCRKLVGEVTKLLGHQPMCRRFTNVEQMMRQKALLASRLIALL